MVKPTLYFPWVYIFVHYHSITDVSQLEGYTTGCETRDVEIEVVRTVYDHFVCEEWGRKERIFKHATSMMFDFVETYESTKKHLRILSYILTNFKKRVPECVQETLALSPSMWALPIWDN